MRLVGVLKNRRVVKIRPATEEDQPGVWPDKVVAEIDDGLEKVPNLGPYLIFRAYQEESPIDPERWGASEMTRVIFMGYMLGRPPKEAEEELREYYRKTYSARVETLKDKFSQIRDAFLDEKYEDASLLRGFIDAELGLLEWAADVAPHFTDEVKKLRDMILALDKIVGPVKIKSMHPELVAIMEKRGVSGWWI